MSTAIKTACDDARRVAYVDKRLLRRGITPRYETVCAGGTPGPPGASDVRGDEHGGPCADADGAEAVTSWSSCMTAF